MSNQFHWNRVWKVAAASCLALVPLTLCSCQTAPITPRSAQIDRNQPDREAKSSFGQANSAQPNFGKLSYNIAASNRGAKVSDTATQPATPAKIDAQFAKAATPAQSSTAARSYASDLDLPSKPASSASEQGEGSETRSSLDAIDRNVEPAGFFEHAPRRNTPPSIAPSDAASCMAGDDETADDPHLAHLAGFAASSNFAPRGGFAGGAGFPALPPEAYTGYEGDGYTVPGVVPDFMQPLRSQVNLNDGGFSDPSVKEGNQRLDVPVFQDQVPMAVTGCGPWKPQGISSPWPEDEYIYDGGDADGGVKVRADGSLLGLDNEDTVAHYDTLDGRTVVKPTNRVCIYAPRFSAVRQVTGAYGENQLVRAGGVHMPLGPERQDKVLPVNTALQPVQAIGETANRSPVTFKDQTPPVGLIAQMVLRATVDRLKPYENFQVIRTGLLEEGEAPFLAQSVQSAIVWTLDQGVEVAANGKKAVVLEGDKRAQATFSIEPPKHPCLRVCKVASSPSAVPGQQIDFTIRFDNVGDQTIGNVTIVDNLTTRLELVPDSGQSSKQAKFFTEPNKEGSLILHWELADPLKPGEGGIARFRCIVR